MNEHNIEAVARAIAGAEWTRDARLRRPERVACDGAEQYAERSWGLWTDHARAAHSVIAGKVAELTEALIEARSAIATWSETPCEHDYKKHDALCYIDAALAPYPERRSE